MQMERKTYVERLRTLQAFMAVRRAELTSDGGGTPSVARGLKAATVKWKLLAQVAEDRDYDEAATGGVRAPRKAAPGFAADKVMGAGGGWPALLCRGCRNWLGKEES